MYLNASVAMPNPSVLITGATPSATAETVRSRFGDITVDASKGVTFPLGLLGIPDKCNYAVAKFPSEKMEQFMLLQSLDDVGLSFITLPIAMANPMIGEADLKSACQDMQMDENNVAILLIVTVHRKLDQVNLSVNVRAPLLIDTQRKLGVQYVFPNDTYKVQHML